jgi:hypothetical protein
VWRLASRQRWELQIKLKMASVTTKRLEQASAKAVIGERSGVRKPRLRGSPGNSGGGNEAEGSGTAVP